jgi:hypothetical protein
MCIWDGPPALRHTHHRAALTGLRPASHGMHLLSSARTLWMSRAHAGMPTVRHGVARHAAWMGELPSGTGHHDGRMRKTSAVGESRND